MGNAMPSSYIAEMTQMDPMSMEDLIAMNVDRVEYTKNNGILGSVSGSTSTISSSVLIWMIARSHKGLSTTQHRILLGLSVCDLISSLGCSTFNSMAPSDNDYYVWNARGNKATCDAQGFLIAFGVAGGLCYNAMLCLYYVAVVKYGKSEDYIRTKIEPFLHGIPIVVGLAMSIIGLVKNHINDNGGICVAPVYIPLHCQGYDVGDVRDGFEIPCYRGSEGGDTFLVLQMVGLFIPAIIIIASLVSIYRAVKKQENKLKKYGVNTSNNNSSSSVWERIKTSLTSLSRRSLSSTNTNAPPAMRSNNMQSQSRAIMHRAFQYSAAWCLSYGMYTLEVITNYQIVFVYLATIFVPLQGFFNLCIFMYPKVISARKPKRGQDKKEVSWCQAISIAFWSRGKETRKRNRPKPSSSNLRDDRNKRPLRAIIKKKSTNDDGRIIKTPHFFCDNKMTTKDKKTHYRHEPQEEEEKCEIQPPSNMVVSDHHNKVSHLKYAPNITQPDPDSVTTTTTATVTHPVDDSTRQDVGQGFAASETSDHEGAASEASNSVEGDGKEESLVKSSDISKQDESWINSSIEEDVSSECNDVATASSIVKNEAEMKNVRKRDRRCTRMIIEEKNEL